MTIRRLVTLLLVAVFAAVVAGGAGADAPVITVPPDQTAEATSAAGAAVTYPPATATNGGGNQVEVTCDPASGSIFPLGTKVVTCAVVNDPSTTATFNVTVQDTTPPTLNLPSNATGVADASGNAIVTYTATATDLVDGTFPADCTPASGASFALGDTIVNCTATDHADNAATPGSFTVTVSAPPPDSTAPVISNVPAPITAEATGPGGASVPYTLPTATDDVDGTVPVHCDPAPGSTFPLGPATTVTCNASDAAGNKATPATFTVTVLDRTKPSLALPPAISTPATSSGGATVTYTATATDLVDGSITPSCTPVSGSPFPIGASTVTCTATDAHSNTATGTFKVTITDAGAPTFSNVPGPQRVEATGPNGATVTYTTPTATDPEEGPIAQVHCAPASGSTFPLGDTTVTCDASDSAGNTSHASFVVTIVDTTAPTLSVASPTTVQASSSSGMAASASPVAAFLHAYLVSDLVDPSPSVTTNAPAVFPIGTTTVTFTARDASGNVATKTATLTVLAPPPPSAPFTPPPLPPPPVVIPPPSDATAFKATPARGKITLRWTIPTSTTAIDHFELTRAQASNGTATTTLYSGKGSSFVDTHVKDGAAYRYQLVSVDAAGNRSTGVALTATPLPLKLLAPLPGKILRVAPMLKWLPTPKARYYNVQIFRQGAKVLSTWPTKAHFKVKGSWKYLGHKYKLSPGTYAWYVWAGFGSRAARKYSPLLGQASFTIAPPLSRRAKR